MNKATVEAKPCTLEMLNEIEPRDGSEVSPSMQGVDFRHSVAIIVDGRTIAAGGIHPIWDRVGEAWTVLSDESITKYRLSTAKHIKKHFDKHMENFGRVQMFGRADDPAMLHWAKFFGFKIDGELENFGPGAKGNYWLFGRIN